MPRTTKLVRVSKVTAAKVAEIAEREGSTMGAVIALAVDALVAGPGRARRGMAGRGEGRKPRPRAGEIHISTSPARRP